MAKYSKKLVEELCSFLEDGLSQKDAATLVGIGESTFYEWVDEKPEFSESVELALSKYKRRLLRFVNKDAATNGKLALEVLSRRWPKEFGHKSQTTVEEGGTVVAQKDDVKKFAKDLLALTN